MAEIGANNSKAGCVEPSTVRSLRLFAGWSTNFDQPAGCNPSPQMRERVTPNWIALLVGPFATNGHCGTISPGPMQAIGGGPSVKRSAAHSGWRQSVTTTPSGHSMVEA